MELSGAAGQSRPGLMGSLCVAALFTERAEITG
jgi:hypothetical protein